MATRFVASMRNMTVDSETVMLDAWPQDRQPLPVTTNIGKTIIMESKPDHLEALIQRYPRLFHGEPPPALSEVPPEWADLIDKLCADIDQLVLKESVWFQVNQIKEKFGTLRFHFSAGDPETRKLDAPFGAGPPDKLAAAERLRDAVRILIREAENRTGRQ